MTDDERWLRRLLEACRTALEQAEDAEFPPQDDYIDDLRRVTADVERRLDERRSLAG
jgi:hypothetical protein